MESVAPSERTLSARAVAGLIVGLAVSGTFLWLAVRNADLGVVLDELRDARLAPVLAAVVAFFAGYALQAVRWRRIADTPGLGWPRFYGMVLGGLACNNVLPVRIGELLRARWLSSDAPMPGGRALGTIALDRACDVVTLALFLAVGLNVVASPGWLVRMAVGAAVLLVLIAAALVFARQYARRRPRDRRGRGRVRRIARDTIETLAEPIGRRRAATWMALSIGTWSLGTVAVVFVARSVGIDLTPFEAVFVSAALALGVAIPSSPGYVGTYQWIGVASLGLLDVPVNEALAFTILMQATWYVPTTVTGGAFVGLRALRRR